jgi:threonine dehydrogenase-like Zn-dependent dehydrogenase
MATETKMKALHYDGPFKVSIKEIDLPKIEHPDDVIIKVTTAAICGSDLHMYQGRTAAEGGLVFGHENMGVVTEIGSGVTLLEKGDRIVLPFNVADGRCRNCEEGKTAFCTGVNPGFAGGAYGYVAMGPYQGGQAQYLRVPFADFNALKLPRGTEHEADFALLADFPHWMARPRAQRVPVRRERRCVWSWTCRIDGCLLRSDPWSFECFRR